MLAARKSAWFERLFAVYNRNLLARRFQGLRVAGLGALRARPRDLPLVLYANHSSWWDGLMAFQVGRACGLDHYVMMEERQLRLYPLFRRLGAFSVVREDAREAARSVRYGADLLRGTPRALWIFPQGRIRPNDERPLLLFNGAAHIIHRAGGAYAAPVAFRYEFMHDYRPEAFARIGALEEVRAGAGFDAKQQTALFAKALTRTLDELREDVMASSFDDYEELVAPRRRREKSS
jgi:1-acyl-sn-glycerol-3-phosphate acyltransferase